MNENTIRFGDDTACLSSVSLNTIKEAEYHGDFSYDEDSDEWIASDEDIFAYWRDIDKALGAAEEAWETLEGMHATDQQEEYPTLWHYANDHGYEDFAYDVHVCDALTDKIREKIASMLLDAEHGEVICHIREHMDSDFDYLDCDLIKGEHGYYLKGEGGARTIFGEEEEFSHCFHSGSGVLLVDRNDWMISPSTKEELVELVRDETVPLGRIDTSQITDMSHLFNTFNTETALFDFPERKDYSGIENWDVSNVESMEGMFEHCRNFNQPINGWNVSRVKDMGWMFADASSFNQPLDKWDTAKVENMRYMFAVADSFNQPLESWDVSSVKDMSNMFFYAEAFNQPLDKWNVSKVEHMESMFQNAIRFDQPLDKWNVSHVTDMGMMFADAQSFNQPLNSWDVSGVENMDGMFRYAPKFNQPLDQWDVSKAKNMESMFLSASSFNQSLDRWDISKVESVDFMFDGAKSLENKNLKKTVTAWKKRNKECAKVLKEAMKDKEASAGR